MNYLQKLKYRFQTEKGWINDPNGLTYFNGYYHLFFQHAPDYEKPWKQPMHWGHARTKDFLTWEELPVALFPDTEYDGNGCWSGTATVKDGTLYLIYASIHRETNAQTVSVAYSNDGITFKKYEENPVIENYPSAGGPDFRDPAVCAVNGEYYLVMATGNPGDKAARLLLYKSENLFDWTYENVMSEWQNGKYAECPSFLPANDGKFLLTTSVCPLDKPHFFSITYGAFCNGKFTPEVSAEIYKGPDQYAGQVFRDDKGRNVLISWIPGWSYVGFAEKDIGCMSVPQELKLIGGKIYCYPVEELQFALKDSDPSVKITDEGFIIERSGREPVVYKGKIKDIKILRDGYVVEVFINGGQEVYTAIL